MGTSLGTSLSDVRVTGARVRDETESTASAAAAYNVDVTVAGNDNWIPYVKENRHWRVSNCTLLPIGGTSTSGKSD